MKHLLRILCSAVYVAGAGFCTFGALASFEIPDWSHRLPWLLGYGLIGAWLLRRLVALWFPARSRRAADSTKAASPPALQPGTD